MQILDGRKTDSATGQQKCVQGLDKNVDKSHSQMLGKFEYGLPAKF